MTPEPALPRPRQVTLAASLVMAGSVLLVASVFERLADLRSLESRTSIQRFLSEPPGSDLGIGTEAVIEILRTLSMVAAGIATATAILGFHVLKRNRSARVALSVLAVPLFLTGLATGGFLASVVAASVALLWLQPSRAWFTGTTPERPSRDPSPPPPPTAPVDRPVPPPSLPPTGTPTPPPWTAYGAPVPWPPPAQPARPSRPTAVIVACAVTWACCAFTALLSLLLVGVLVADADGLFAEMYRQNPSLADDGLSTATLKSMTWVIAIVCLLWALVSSGLAVLAFQRVRWAATSLVVSAGLVAVVCLGGSLVSPVLAAPGVLAAVVVVLLLQPGPQRWLSRHGEHAGPTA